MLPPSIERGIDEAQLTDEERTALSAFQAAVEQAIAAPPLTRSDLQRAADAFRCPGFRIIIDEPKDPDVLREIYASVVCPALALDFRWPEDENAMRIKG